MNSSKYTFHYDRSTFPTRCLLVRTENFLSELIREQLTETVKWSFNLVSLDNIFLERMTFAGNIIDWGDLWPNENPYSIDKYLLLFQIEGVFIPLTSRARNYSASFDMTDIGVFKGKKALKLLAA